MSKDQHNEINWISPSQIYDEKIKSGRRNKKNYAGRKISKLEWLSFAKRSTEVTSSDLLCESL